MYGRLPLAAHALDVIQGDAVVGEQSSVDDENSFLRRMRSTPHESSEETTSSTMYILPALLFSTVHRVFFHVEH